MMKRVIAACIDQVLEFDSEDSLEEYIKDLQFKKQWFRILHCGFTREHIMIRIQKQYNRHTFENMSEGGDVEC